MSYPVEYGKSVLKHMEDRNKQVDAIQIFKVGQTAIHEWRKKLEETGTCEGVGNHPLLPVYSNQKSWSLM